MTAVVEHHARSLGRDEAMSDTRLKVTAIDYPGFYAGLNAMATQLVTVADTVDLEFARATVEASGDRTTNPEIDQPHVPGRRDRLCEGAARPGRRVSADLSRQARTLRLFAAGLRG
ncbi:hypothetical protein [Herbidospora cretacea]|uniref:hypothetical protein n=1 Tax=Herbidospora cretacea TaxID=28444 RepID=UPI001C3F1DD7|nr:hypothetical protein [Herbidospora cretacea]